MGDCDGRILVCAGIVTEGALDRLSIRRALFGGIIRSFPPKYGENENDRVKNVGSIGNLVDIDDIKVV